MNFFSNRKSFCIFQHGKKERERKKNLNCENFSRFPRNNSDTSADFFASFRIFSHPQKRVIGIIIRIIASI